MRLFKGLGLNLQMLHCIKERMLIVVLDVNKQSFAFTSTKVHIIFIQYRIIFISFPLKKVVLHFMLSALSEIQQRQILHLCIDLLHWSWQVVKFDFFISKNCFLLLQNYIGSDFAVCPFNARHEMPKPELRYHLANCPDKAVIEPMLAYGEHF